ncbi:MAG: type I restriction endonuclease subunit R, partial [Eubacterium sp.]|nr:type I restriction endonuclease subunit R [Eubacterium sp.]
DECHRSQFGELHTQIVKHFKNYHIFGFTGTPIFADNASTSGRADLKTTGQAFGDKLHTYTIVDAINDGNVLPFRIDYVNTLSLKDTVTDKKVEAINQEEVLNSGVRVAEIVDYILTHFDQKTKRNSFYDLKGQRVNGFNSMLAVSSIPMAKKYYLEFKKQMEQKGKRLSVATIFSFAPNEDDPLSGILSEEEFDTEGLDVSSREFLDSCIEDYNKMFNTNYDSSSKGFQNYYKDLSQKVKDREVDLLIVVNMFLTGFDATTLNTLWVDKNLKQHGLIQAFSRTNRILNSVKTYGNIICFRDLQKETNDAIALFGDKNASGTVLLKSYNDYYYGYTDDKGKKQKGYEERIAELIQKYPLGEDLHGTYLLGEKAKKDFVVLFSSILRLRNILSAFDQFAGNEILSERDFQDYTGYYTDVYEEIKPKPGDKESIIHDVVFEMELVKQVEVNIDYILMLVAKYHDSNCQDKEILVSIDKAIKSSLELRSKRELIEKFIERVNADTNVDTDWKDFVDKQKNIDLNLIITEQRLKAAETKKFMKNAFRDGVLRTTGNDIDEILPAVSRFGGGGNRKQVKATVIEKLKEYFDKYYGLITDDMSFDTKYEYNAGDMGLMMVAEENKWNTKK